MKSDIEIANAYQGISIFDLAKRIGIHDYLEPYGKWKGKIDLSILDRLKEKKDGKLILVTSTSPTPMGEGKTTMAIGLHDALCKLGYSSMLALREPSLGPVFGIKGGATGGGYAQVYPMDEINLHFTGDMHAITSANNLLSAAIDNHIYQGNQLNINLTKIVHKRCLDLNDRSLRQIEIGMSQLETTRKEQFVITVATELMAIMCLATSLSDLKRRIGNILFAYNKNGNPLFVSDLHVEDAMTILLKDAFKPNLVQTLEGNPVLIHGGPFANIAHGCNSLIATKLALKLGNYVVTEAGFGSDLGAEKFFDIKCQKGNLRPDVVVLNMTIRSMKYHGGVSKDDLKKENIEPELENLSSMEEELYSLKEQYNSLQKTKVSIELVKSLLARAYENMKNSVSPVFTRKLSENIEKVTNPGYKTVWRLFDKESNKAIADVLTLGDEIIDDSIEIQLVDPSLITFKSEMVSEIQIPVRRRLYD